MDGSHVPFGNIFFREIASTEFQYQNTTKHAETPFSHLDTCPIFNLKNSKDAQQKCAHSFIIKRSPSRQTAAAKFKLASENRRKSENAPL